MLRSPLAGLKSHLLRAISISRHRSNSSRESLLPNTPPLSDKLVTRIETSNDLPARALAWKDQVVLCQPRNSKHHSLACLPRPARDAALPRVPPSTSVRSAPCSWVRLCARLGLKASLGDSDPRSITWRCGVLSVGFLRTRGSPAAVFPNPTCTAQTQAQALALARGDPPHGP